MASQTNTTQSDTGLHTHTPKDNNSILLIEDNLAVRDLITLALRRYGYKVIAVRSEQEAIDCLAIHQPLVMLFDVLLPQANGLDLLRQLKEMAVLEQTAVIIISALGFREVVEKAKEIGAQDFLIKPFDVDELVAKVQRVKKRTEVLSAKRPSTL